MTAVCERRRASLWQAQALDAEACRYGKSSEYSEKVELSRDGTIDRDCSQRLRIRRPSLASKRSEESQLGRTSARRLAAVNRYLTLLTHRSADYSAIDNCYYIFGIGSLQNHVDRQVVSHSAQISAIRDTSTRHSPVLHYPHTPVTATFATNHDQDCWGQQHLC